MILRTLFISVFANLLLSVVCTHTERPNVKTSLFTEMDIRRSCWNHDAINLLRARMIMQDLIPNKVPKDLPYLVEFVRSTEDAVVRHSPEGKVRRIMMLALTDVLGGYLQSVAMPLAKEAYYAGNIDYATMNRLHEMLKEMRSRLRTDGGRWSRPIDMSKFATKVTSLRLSRQNPDLACRAIFVVPADECTPGNPRISIPYLDYDVKPGAVALPLKARNLYSLKTSASSHIIVRFYILARECLSQMKPSETEVFNHHFVQWLGSSVVPHLYEEQWYPGFGSVMRIMETVNGTYVLNNNMIPVPGNDSDLEKQLTKCCGVGHYLKNMVIYHPLFLALVLLIILVLILACCCCVFCLMKCRGNGGGFLGKKSSGVLNAALSVYCGLKDKNDERSVGSQQNRPSESTTLYEAYPPPKGTTSYDTTSTFQTSSDDEESVMSTP